MTALVAVSELGTEPSQVETLALELRQELLELDVDAVETAPAQFAPPGGSRAVDAAALGTLIVTFEQSLPLVRALVDVVQGWLKRTYSSNRSVEITIGTHSLRLTGASAEHQDRLVDEFITAVTGG